MFAKQLSEVVQKAFAAVGGEESVGEAITPPASPVEADVAPADALDDSKPIGRLALPGMDDDASKVEHPADGPHGTADFSPSLESIPARMLNEFVYCPRLFYYEHVEGVFVESADTVRGAAVHARVDKGSGAMPRPGGAKGAPEPGEGDGVEAKPAAEGPQGREPVERDEIHRSIGNDPA